MIIEKPITIEECQKHTKKMLREQAKEIFKDIEIIKRKWLKR